MSNIECYSWTRRLLRLFNRAGQLALKGLGVSMESAPQGLRSSAGLVCWPLCATALLAWGGCARSKSEWETVQELLASTRDIVVLDGTEMAPLRALQESEPERGDWLVRHELSDPENFNPYTSSDAGASRVLGYIFESLLFAENEPPYRLKGRLAREYPTVSDDRLSYTFLLRDDAHFADGKALTAEDVLFSMKVIQNPRVLAPHLRNYFAAVKDARLEGMYSISFLCDVPYFRNDLMLGHFEIIPRHFYDPEGLLDPVSVAELVDGSWEKGPHAERIERFAQQFNHHFNRKVLGSGPYLIADFDRDVVTQQKVELTRNAKYWGVGRQDLPAPGYVDRIVFRTINNTDAAFIELINGKLDYYGLSPLEFREKSWSADFVRRYLKGVEYSTGYLYIGWNNHHPIFRDRRVRQAMTLLIDERRMIENLLFGLGEVVQGPIHKFRPEYNHDLQPYGYDPDRALELLQQAGWSDRDRDGLLEKEIEGEWVPFRFEMLINSGNQIRKDIALILQHELRDIGIDCQVRELDWSIFLQRLRGRDFAAAVSGWTGGVVFPPDGYQIWHSSQAVEQGSNYISFSHPEVDRILEQYRQEFDLERRIAWYRRFQEILHEEQPYTFLWTSRVARAYSRRFSGVNWYPAGVDLQEWWVKPENRLYR